MAGGGQAVAPGTENPQNPGPEGHPIDPPFSSQGGGGPIDPPEGVTTGGGPISAERAAGGASDLRGGEAAGGGRPITEEAIFRGGRPIGGAASIFNIGGAPVNAGTAFVAGSSVQLPGAFRGGEPVGGPASIFNIGGAPIAVLGGVFSGGLPLGGPVTQLFRSSGPQPNTLFLSTLSPSGPIGNFLIGSGGAPIGVDTFGGGGLPIGPTPAIAQAIVAIGAPTALVGPPAVSFASAQALGPAPPIGGGGSGGLGSPIGEDL
jgi:hypothetical protein